MSAHTKVRKVYPLVDGSHCEITIQIHNFDPREADGIVARVISAATVACDDVKELLGKRDQTEAEARAARLRALIEQVDPVEKVISHGTAERHNAPQEPAAKPAKKGRK